MLATSSLTLRARPTIQYDCGSAQIVIWAGGPARAVALTRASTTGVPVLFTARTSRDCVPAERPSVHVFGAEPTASVVTAATNTVPPPAGTNVTSWFGTAVPLASVTFTAIA